MKKQLLRSIRTSMPSLPVFLMIGTLALSSMWGSVHAMAKGRSSIEAGSDLFSLPSTNSNKTQHPVPIKGSYNTTITGVGPTGALHIIKSGRISHLGDATGVTEENADFSIGRNFGTDTLVAANGDTIFATHDGTFTLNPATGVVYFQGTLTFDGGTGRFENAKGSAYYIGTASLVFGTGHVDFSGMIEY